MVGADLASVHFNPRSRVGNDCACFFTVCQFTRFQSTFPRGERRKTNVANNFCPVISIHVPAWGTTGINIRNANMQQISIHVPAWGTTVLLSFYFSVWKISIHVPAWGTTGKSCVQCCIQCRFQSTFPRGERPVHLGTCIVQGCISIHVPAWGTTYLCCIYVGNLMISIHVPAWGTTVSIRTVASLL